MDNDHSRILLSIILFAVGGACLYLVFPTVWNSGEWDGPIDFILFFALPIVVTCAIGIWQMYDEWDMWWIAELLLLLGGGGMMYMLYEHYPQYESTLLPCIVYIVMAAVCVIMRVFVYAQEYADYKVAREKTRAYNEELVRDKIRAVTGINVHVRPGVNNSYIVSGLQQDLDALILLQQEFHVTFTVIWHESVTHKYTAKDQEVGYLESGSVYTGDYQRVSIRSDVEKSYDTEERRESTFQDFPSAVKFLEMKSGSLWVQFKYSNWTIEYSFFG